MSEKSIKGQLVLKEGQPFMTLEDSTADALEPIREEATKAYNALADLAGHKSVTGLLHEGQTEPPTDGEDPGNSRRRRRLMGGPG